MQNSLKDMIKHSYEDYAGELPNKGWNDLENRLNFIQDQKTKKKRRAILFVFSILAAFSAGSVFKHYWRSDAAISETNTNTPVEQGVTELESAPKENTSDASGSYVAISNSKSTRKIGKNTSEESIRKDVKLSQAHTRAMVSGSVNSGLHPKPEGPFIEKIYTNYTINI